MLVFMDDLAAAFFRHPAVLATQAVGYTMPGAVRPVQFTQQQEESIQRSVDLYTPPVGRAPSPAAFGFSRRGRGRRRRWWWSS